MVKYEVNVEKSNNCTTLIVNMYEDDPIFRLGDREAVARKIPLHHASSPKMYRNRIRSQAYSEFFSFMDTVKEWCEEYYCLEGQFIHVKEKNSPYIYEYIAKKNSNIVFRFILTLYLKNCPVKLNNNYRDFADLFDLLKKFLDEVTQ